MQEQPPFTSPPQQPLPTTFWQRHKKPLLIGTAFIILLSVAITAGLFVKQRRNADSGLHGNNSPSIIMYYRDGKTVLWESKASDWMSDAPTGPVSVVRDELKTHYGSSTFEDSAWKVVTTFDPSLQAAAIEQLKASQGQREKQRADQAVLIAQDVTNGQIVSWAAAPEGSNPDIGTKKMEVATLALPFAYAALMEHDTSFTAATKIADSQEQLPGYPCTNRSRPAEGGNCLHNFDYRFKGLVTVTEALATLRVVPAVHTSIPLLGPGGASEKLQTYTEALTEDGKFACYLEESLDESTETSCYASAVFGDGLYAQPLNIVSVYSTLANTGKKMPATSILNITKGKEAVYEWRADSGEQAIKESAVRAVADILKDAQASYLLPYKDAFTVNGQKAGIIMGVESSAITSSTVHFTSKYAVGVWVTATEAIAGAGETLVIPPATNWLQAAHQ